MERMECVCEEKEDKEHKLNVLVTKGLIVHNHAENSEMISPSKKGH